MTDLDERLSRASHAVLTVWTGAPGHRRLLAVSSPAWWDGAGVWLAGGPAAAALREQPSCVALLSAGDAPEVAVRGDARVYGLHDPLALALHAAAIAGVVGALALRDAAGVRRVLPGRSREVAVRLLIDEADALRFPVGGGGVAPALPPEVPSDVRRALAGARAVTVVDPTAPGARAATWGGGLRLDLPEPASDWCAVIAHSGLTGLALEGPVSADGTLRPERAQWWRDRERGEAVVRGGVGAIVLPD